MLGSADSISISLQRLSQRNFTWAPRSPAPGNTTSDTSNRNRSRSRFSRWLKLGQQQSAKSSAHVECDCLCYFSSFLCFFTKRTHSFIIDKVSIERKSNLISPNSSTSSLSNCVILSALEFFHIGTTS